MLLNQEQEELKDKIFTFLLDPTKEEFIISGAAGTGKSFFINYVNTTLLQDYKDTCKLFQLNQTIENVYFSGTTNKATALLDNADRTIYSLCGLKILTNYKTGENYLKNSGNSYIESNSLIFIDEASMLDKESYRMIKHIIFNLHTNCKIIYVGDKYQLKSPKSNFSVFDLKIDSYDLNTVIRSKNNSDLTKLSTILRENVQLGIIADLDLLDQTTKIIGKQELNNLIKTNFITTDNTMFVSYTNKTVQNFINYVLKTHNLNTYIIENNTVVNNNFVSTKYLDKFNRTPIIKTDEELLILEIDLTLNRIFTYFDAHIEGYRIKVRNSFGLEFWINIPFNNLDINLMTKILTKAKRFDLIEILQRIPILRPKYAQTIHKSQGSTITNIVVDGNDLMSCTVLDTKLRLLYVACSRAIDTVYLYDSTKD